MTLSEDRGMTGIPPTLAISVLPGVPPSIQTERLNKIDVYTTFAKVGGKVPKKLTIEEMREIAHSRGGKCLSDEYINTKTNLKWECSEGHIWWAKPGNIKQNESWCPQCQVYVGERICRDVLEKLFGEQFSKVRPKWLKNSTGHSLELDGFCEELGVAFEYHGGHHYKQSFPNCSLESQVKRDTIKSETCLKMGIKLLIIPYTVKLPDIPIEIIKQCRSFGFFFKVTKLSMYDIGTIRFINPRLKEIRDISQKRGGDCLSPSYYDSVTKLTFVCKHGHTWDAIPTNVKGGAWCPICARIDSRNTIEMMKEWAILRGGECLSEDYNGIKTKLKWKCADGHVWTARPDHIKTGTWCPYCVGMVKMNIEQMRNIAKEKGGICLSREYVNSYTKLEWQCSKGHKWFAQPSSIKNVGTWCRVCNNNNNKLTINEMHTIAKERGGKCLSSEYVNSKTKITWECNKGHRWSATPSSIKEGSWCRICYVESTKLTIEVMQLFAVSKGGVCLSKKYVNSGTTLEWRCSVGHTWWANRDNILQGKWCPECYRNSRSKNKEVKE